MKKLTKLKILRSFFALCAVAFLFLGTFHFIFIFMFLLCGYCYSSILERMREEEGRLLQLDEEKETREIQLATDRRLNIPHVQNDLYEHSNY